MGGGKMQATSLSATTPLCTDGPKKISLRMPEPEVSLEQELLVMQLMARPSASDCEMNPGSDWDRRIVGRGCSPMRLEIVLRTFMPPRCTSAELTAMESVKGE